MAITGGTRTAATSTRMKNPLMPRLDLAYTALLEDLIRARDAGGHGGLLAASSAARRGVGLSLGTGAGRDGRDHYPSCFCGVLAGGRVRPGMVHGTSDSKAASPNRDPVTPEDLAATLFAAMGLNPEAIVEARDGRPMPVSHGHPVNALLT